MKKAYGNIVKYSKLIRIRTDYGTASLKLFHDTKREDIIAEIYEATKTPKDKNFYLITKETESLYPHPFRKELNFN